MAQLLISVIFVELFAFVQLQKDASRLADLSSASLRIFRASDVSDETKESFARQASVKALRITISIVLKFLFVILAIYIVSAIAAHLISLPEEEFLLRMVSPAVIFMMTGAAIAYAWIRYRIIRRHRPD
jgi:hypothetical protein